MTKFTVVEEALADPGPGLVSPKAFAQIIKRRWLPIVLTMAAVSPL